MLHDEVKEKKIKLALMSVRIPVKQALENSGFIDELEPGHLIENRGAVIDFLFKSIDHDYCKNVCPHKLFFECSTVK